MSQCMGMCGSKMCDEHCYGKKSEPVTLVFTIHTIDNNAALDVITKVFKDCNQGYYYMDKYHPGIEYTIQTRELI